MCGLFLYPALVQGEGAVSSIVNGIRALDALGVDVIIVGRGGGSIEDLWAFNEEEVARAIFECETPVISAVGHQTDTTIADFVADLRAPTPSGAAELAVFDHQAAVAEISAKTARMNRALRQKLDIAKLKVNQYQTKLQYVSPESRSHEHRRYAVDLEEKIIPADGAGAYGKEAQTCNPDRSDGRGIPFEEAESGVLLCCG